VEGWQRGLTEFQSISKLNGWRSPRLGISVHLEDERLQIRYPDRRPFMEAWESIQRADKEAERAERLAAKLRALEADPDQL